MSAALMETTRPQFRSRRKFTSPGQKRVLEFVFCICPKPSKEFQRYLSSLLGMEVKRVRVWFQNKRTRGSEVGELASSEEEVQARMRMEIGTLMDEFESARREQNSMFFKASQVYQLLPQQPSIPNPAPGNNPTAFSGFALDHQQSHLSSGQLGALAAAATTDRPAANPATPMYKPNPQRQQMHSFPSNPAPVVGQKQPASSQATFATPPRKVARLSGSGPSPRTVSVSPEGHCNPAILSQLCSTIMSGNVSSVRALLMSGDVAPNPSVYLNTTMSNINAVNSAACLSNATVYEQMMRTLLEFGLDLSHSSHRVALHHAVGAGNHGAVKYLVDAGVPLLLRDERFDTALHVAAGLGDAEAITILLGPRQSIDALNGQSETALHVACKQGSNLVARALLVSGADANCRTSSGDAPLHLALRHGNTDVASALLEHSPRLDVINSAVESPLHELIKANVPRSKKIDILQRMYRSVVGTEALQRFLQLRNCDGETPLHLAAGKGEAFVVQALLQCGFDKDAMTFQLNDAGRFTGKSARTIAAERGLKTVLHVLDTHVSAKNAG